MLFYLLERLCLLSQRCRVPIGSTSLLLRGSTLLFENDTLLGTFFIFDHIPFLIISVLKPKFTRSSRPLQNIKILAQSKFRIVFSTIFH